jgi:hypothetical protein
VLEAINEDENSKKAAFILLDQVWFMHLSHSGEYIFIRIIIPERVVGLGMGCLSKGITDDTA